MISGINQPSKNVAADSGEICGKQTHARSQATHGQSQQNQSDAHVHCEMPNVGVQKYEAVLELTYRLYFRKSALFFQPDLQYVIRPGGTGKFDDALVLGCQIGVNF